MKLIKELASNHSHNLTEKEVNYLSHFDFKTSGFYGLPRSFVRKLKSKRNHSLEIEFLGQQISNSGS